MRAFPPSAGLSPCCGVIVTVDRMASFTASELRFCRATLGLEEGDAQSLEETASGFKAAAEAVHAARAAADAQKKEAEILAELGNAHDSDPDLP